MRYARYHEIGRPTRRDSIDKRTRTACAIGCVAILALWVMFVFTCAPPGTPLPAAPAEYIQSHTAGR